MVVRLQGGRWVAASPHSVGRFSTVCWFYARDLHGFEVSGFDGHFHAARARIMNDTTVVATSTHVAHPVTVRYAWSNNPLDTNLIDRDGLPAVPFQTKAP